MNGGIICSHGTIYFQTNGALYAIKDESKESGFGSIPAPTPEPDVKTDLKPAHVQVVPADGLIRPGDSQSYKVKLYNARGQFLKMADNVKFSIDGPGNINSNGEFTVGADGAHQATIVTASVGELTGQARVRIVPPLPWHFDFEDIDIVEGKGEPPISWVGARYRHVVREKDGNKAMVKITTIPKGARSRCWMGHSDFHDYTIQADVQGAISNNKLPDIGLIAQGYALDLQGENQALEIRTWVTQRRMAKKIAFPWEPNKWYTMKFRAANEGGEAVLRGKVWPKGEEEPEEWSIVATDEVPNRTGSPGLFGNAKDAEITLDNISVVEN